MWCWVCVHILIKINNILFILQVFVDEQKMRRDGEERR